jgi:hypothetical protein
MLQRGRWEKTFSLLTFPPPQVERMDPGLPPLAFPSSIACSIWPPTSGRAKARLCLPHHSLFWFGTFAGVGMGDGTRK